MKHRCRYCGRWFRPYARKGKTQKTCGDEECRRRHKRAWERLWKRGSETWRQSRRKKVREWAKGQDYWRQWRAEHPDYVERNRHQSRKRMRDRRIVEAAAHRCWRKRLAHLSELKALLDALFAKPDLLQAKIPEKSRRIRAWPRVFAKPDLLERLLDGMVDHLASQTMFANRKGPDARQ